ncbi:putative MFS-type transporter [Mycobacterium marinum]|nr:putative membrane protein [Mycobacterium marinum MB2]GJO16129.1 putative MFS-type transporter [Mycobacterium marinum]GJO47363.1 putative MFS-type transporter [Mycobacterium marinum]GJP27718.1 putative MFS-type transporter [Mycobacterium marinum]
MIRSRMHASAPVELWRSVRSLPDFWRLLQVRIASQFGDGLFQAGLAGALLFNPDRAADPMAIARAFAVLFLPYSLLGPFAGALMDRWDRRLVIVGANIGRLILIAGIGTILAFEAGDLLLLFVALLANGLARFVASGLSASLPHVVPREQVVTMNSVATASGAVAAFVGANFMLLPRWLAGGGDHGAAAVIFTAMIPVAISLLLALRFAPRVLGPDDTKRAIHGSAVYAVITGWMHGVRTVVQLPTVAAALSGLAAHRMVVGVNSLLILLLVHHMRDVDVEGLGTALLFFAATGLGAFLANVLTPGLIRRWGRYATTNGALAAAAVIQLAGAGLLLPVMVVCGFLLGVAGQVVKLCADSAMQIDVDDALRGHVFAVQDALFWVSYIVSVTVAAALIPDDGRAPVFVLVGSVIYLLGLCVHSIVGRRSSASNVEGG